LKRPHLHLIRGLPGSGKTTIALTKWVPLGYAHFENDMYYIREGVYTYDPAEAAEAREWCEIETFKALESGRNVVVCNAFISRWSARPYREMCREGYGWMTFEVAIGNYPNTHSVKPAVIDRMFFDWEDWPKEWQWPEKVWRR
jgi:predicted kinase